MTLLYNAQGDRDFRYFGIVYGLLTDTQYGLSVNFLLQLYRFSYIIELRK